jgi:hypothetical protein
MMEGDRMNGTDRKAAVLAYKERKTIAGIYAVRCSATGDCWVGQAPDLGAIQNRLWFTLKLGMGAHRGMQAAWKAQGMDQFTFEELERMPEEALPFARAALVKKRLDHWRATLKADAVSL